MDEPVKQDENEVEMPGKVLLRHLVAHHKKALDGIMHHMPSLENEETKEAIKCYAMHVHKGLNELCMNCKGYGIDNCELPKELEHKSSEDSGIDEQGDLAEDTVAHEDDLTPDETKMFQEQIKALEDQAEAEEYFLLQHSK